MSFKRIGIINSGGDCPGLNAVIASVVKSGAELGYEFYGFIKGWEGLLDPIQFMKLDPDAVRGIAHLGGTILGTVNKGRFGAKAGEGNSRQIPEDVLHEARDNCKALGLSGLIVIGGDGTLSGALQLMEAGVPIVGVPKTIDNDLQHTDRTFGFSTATQVAVDALDRVHTTATSHQRMIFVETMGRHAGWIAIRAGLAGGADAILIPEFPFALEDLVAMLQRRQAEGRSATIVVAEGAKVHGQRVHEGEALDREVKLGGIAQYLIRAIEEMVPDEFDMRATVLGHIQRGGTPTAGDRALAKAYGVAAMRAFDQGKYGQMVIYHNAGMGSISLADAVGSIKLVCPNTMEYETARALGVFVH